MIASPWRRALAAVIDTLFAFAVYAAVRRRNLLKPLPRSVDVSARAGRVIWEIACHVRWGQTVGERAVGIRVVDQATGRPPTWRRAVLRWSVRAPATILELARPEPIDPQSAKEWRA